MRLHLPKSLLAAVLALSALPGFGAVTFDSTTELTKGVGYLLPYDKGVINLTLDSSVFATQSAGTLLVTCQAGTQGGNPIMGVAAAGEGKFETVLNESGSSFTSRVTGSSALTGSTVKVSITSSGVTVTEDITTGEGESATTSTTTLVSESGLKYTNAPRGYTYTIAENDAITSASLSDGIIIKNLAGSGDLTVPSSVVILDGGGNENINFSMAGKALRIFGNVTLNIISTPSGTGSDIVVAEGASLTTKMLNLDWNPGSLWINGTLNSEAVELKTHATSTLSGSGAVTLGSFKTSNGGRLNSSVANFTVTGDIDLGGAGTGAGATDDTLTISGGTFTAQGTTTVRNGRTLQLGCTNENSTGVTAAQISMNNLVVLSGGTVNMNYMKGSIASVDLQGGTLHYRDCVTKDADNALGITTLTVSANSTFQKTWKGIINVAELTGSGNLSISDNRDTNNVLDFNVTKLHNYTGTISKTSSTTTLTISSVEQDTGKEGTISSAVTLASGFTKTGEGSVSFEGTTNASDVTVSAGTLTFAGGTSISKLSLNGGSTTISGATTVSMFVDITNASSLTVKEGNALSLTGTAGGQGIWMKTGSTVTIENGASVSAFGFKIANSSADSNATLSLATNATNANLGANPENANLVISGADVTITGTTRLQSKIDGGTLTSDVQGASASGSVSVSSVTVKEGKSLDLGGQTSVTGTTSIEGNASLSVSNAQNALGTLTGSGALKSTAGAATVSDASGFTGTLESTGGALTATNVSSTNKLAAVKATGGQISLYAEDASVSVEELTIGTSGQAQAYTSASALGTVTADKVSIGESNAKFQGNLNITGGLTVQVGSNGQTGGLNMAAATGTLTLGSATGTGLELNLSYIPVMTTNDYLTLFTGVDSVLYYEIISAGTGETEAAAVTLSDQAPKTLTEEAVDASKVFKNVDSGYFTVKFVGNDVILTASTNVPEPTTATLSLLALIGLAARRRRRKA